MQGRGGWLGDTVCARQRRGGDIVEPDHADDFLHQIRRAIDIATPAWDSDRCAGYREAERRQDFRLLVRRHINATQLCAQSGVISDGFRGQRRFACANDFRCFTAANVEDQLGDDGNCIIEESRVHAAFETRARIGSEREGLAGLCNPLRREIGDFKQHVGGVVGAARMLAAHDARNVVDACVIGDDGHISGEREVLAVERGDSFSILGATGNDSASELRQIIGMARAAMVEHHIVGDVDECGDRALSGGLQACLHPVRRGAVCHTLDDASVKGGAAVGVVGADFRRAGEAARNAGHHKRLQRAEASCGEITRNTAHAHAILPVGGDGDVDHSIIETCIIGKGCADWRVSGKLNDAVMVITQLQLTRRTHHAV